VFKAGLNSSNMAKAFNTYVMPVVLYSFGVIHWRDEELKSLDVSVRKLLTMHSAHHPRADADRVHIRRGSGGRGLLSAEDLHARSVINLARYLEVNVGTPRLHILKVYHESLRLYSITKQARKNLARLGMDKEAGETTKASIKQACEDRRRSMIDEKAMHGQYFKLVEKQSLDVEMTFHWLKSSSLRPNTEGLIVAVQDQAIATRNYQSIWAAGNGGRCRMCGEEKETVPHIISACPSLARTKYIERHDRVVKYLHWALCKENKIKEVSRQYGAHQLITFCRNERMRLYWEFTIPTAHKIRHNRPDLILVNEALQRVWLIDVSIPFDSNIKVKEEEKISKYEALRVEVERTWKMRAKVVPVVVGAIGGIGKDLQKYLTQVSSTATIAIVQKEALIGTAAVARYVLNRE